MNHVSLLDRFPYPVLKISAAWALVSDTLTAAMASATGRFIKRQTFWVVNFIMICNSLTNVISVKYNFQDSHFYTDGSIWNRICLWVHLVFRGGVICILLLYFFMLYDELDLLSLDFIIQIGRASCRERV